MAKLFIFGIGGTGARVIKSLTMLLAAGVKTNYEIVPILIDPDGNGGDLNRTTKGLREYQTIQKELVDSTNCHFFKNRISSLSEVITRKGKNSNVISGFQYELDGVENDNFRDFIDLGTLDTTNKWLTSLLFSDDNLNSNLEVGFKGNPNIGSVVLNQFTKSDAFEVFASSFERDDRVFIISSIFGGTGAAGFPLILKNIREGRIKGEANEYLRNSVIGALTVQPYFKVSSDETSKIDSKVFISKTKAALHYYSKNVTGKNKSVNLMYYIGDLVSNEYNNREGGVEQKNDAHFVELASALAVVDFANTSSASISTTNGKADNPIFKEYGIPNSNTESIQFKDLPSDTTALIRSTLTEFFYFNIFLKEKLKSELNNPFASGYTNKFDSNFIDDTFYSNLLEFNLSFRIWLGEMQRNKVSFSPFKITPIMNEQHEIIDISINSQSIFSLINGHDEKSSWKNYIPLVAKNYELFIMSLNEEAKIIGNTSTSRRFMEVFSNATQKLITKKLF